MFHIIKPQGSSAVKRNLLQECSLFFIGQDFGYENMYGKLLCIAIDQPCPSW